MSRKHWIIEDLPKQEGSAFPKDGDTIDCKCGLKAENTILGGDEGQGFTCNCGNQLWCQLADHDGLLEWEWL